MYTQLHTQINPALIPPKGFGGGSKGFSEHLDEAEGASKAPARSSSGLALLQSKQNIGLLADLYAAGAA